MNPASPEPKPEHGKPSPYAQKRRLSWHRPWCWPRLILINLLRTYKRYLSPLLPPSCRFTPTCAEYAIEAVSKYGIFRGLFLTCWRLLRCNPFCRGGYDPVP